MLIFDPGWDLTALQRRKMNMYEEAKRRGLTYESEMVALSVDVVRPRCLLTVEDRRGQSSFAPSTNLEKEKEMNAQRTATKGQ